MDNWLKNLRDKYILAPLADRILNGAGLNEEKAADQFSKAVGTPVLRTQALIANGPQSVNNRIKPQGAVSFEVLRNFSVQYDIARACINRRKRQITGLQWDIVPAEQDDKSNYKTQIAEVKKRMRGIGGYKVRLRALMEEAIEDLLVLDAMAIYKRPTMGGDVYSLNPIDGATIQLRVDEAGRTPEPPDIAYKQIIRGKVVAELTADELIYERMNPRTNSPYGLSPLESLILTVSSALKSELYNLNYLTDGNIPEGFFQVPPDWTPTQVSQFQELWDASMSGDTRATAKLRFVPGGQGTGYSPTKKPGDMQFEKFNEWLMKKTCMLFEIQPQELGFTMDVNKATGHTQHQIGVDAGMRPLAEFIDDVFTDFVQQDLGFEKLAFKFMIPDNKDELAEAQTNEVRIRSGQRTVDEVRAEDGLEPIGVDKPFVLGTPVFIDEESVATTVKAQADALASKSNNPNDNSGPNNKNGTDDQKDSGVAKSAEERHVELVTELRTFRKYALARLKDGKQLRGFKSDILPEAAVAEINNRLAKCSTTEQAREVFSEYFQDYQINFLADVADFRRQLAKVV